MKNISIWSFKLFLLAATFSLSGIAGAVQLRGGNDVVLDTVVIGDMFYRCQNTCVVSIFSDGAYSIQDSKGGWMTAKKMNLEK